MLEKVKRALQLTDTTFDTELNAMIDEAKADMDVAGINVRTDSNALYEQCVCLYCCYRFEILHGSVSRSEAIEKLYKEQKRQLGMATGFTTWG